MSVLQVFEDIVTECHRDSVLLLIATANAFVEESLQSMGFLKKLGGQAFMFNRVHEAVRAVLLRKITAADIPRSSTLEISDKTRDYHHFKGAVKQTLRHRRRLCLIGRKVDELVQVRVKTDEMALQGPIAPGAEANVFYCCGATAAMFHRTRQPFPDAPADSDGELQAHLQV